MATYSKPLVATTVYDHSQTDFTFTDTPQVNGEGKLTGEVSRYGTTVRDQILRGDTVDSITVGGYHVVIPYHSVIYATVEEGSEDGFPKTYGKCMTADEGGAPSNGINAPDVPDVPIQPGYDD